MPATADQTVLGLRFGILTVVGELPAIKDERGKRLRMVSLACDCGGTSAARLKNLKSGNTKSCGCRKDAARDRWNEARAREPQAWVVQGGVGTATIDGRAVRVDAEDVPLVPRFVWEINTAGYVFAIKRHGNFALHRLILGIKKGADIEGDHRFHDPLDNRRESLRVATPAQNKQNRRKQEGFTSRFKGVSWDKSKGLWKAQIKDGATRFARRFASEIDAARQYDAWASELFGEFAVLNFQKECHAGN